MPEFRVACEADGARGFTSACVSWKRCLAAHFGDLIPWDDVMSHSETNYQPSALHGRLEFLKVIIKTDIALAPMTATTTQKLAEINESDEGHGSFAPLQYVPWGRQGE